MIHSVDSLHLLAEINRQSEKIGKMMDILIQVNTAADENKFGIRPEELDGFLQQATRFPNISVKGLMTIGRQFADEAGTRRSFQELHKLFVDTKEKKYDNINMIFLSMGMSADYKIAIEEGSNMVRIGTSIFGKRK
ncbi:Pyridoxal phosphate homeostasis protein [bioreactor metagenome]|uniref:Pyridoxal phosphate homeostasis protein n=1 Tax=bioreactor metagenome TaxID=1076179 RepID=A0A645JC15_9ZZZZ